MTEKRITFAAVWAQALFYGSLWGMAEATAGHALHLARIPGLAGFIMFPLGFCLMSRAYSRAGRNILAMFLTSWVAAGIKLVDLLLPGADFMTVWNPAQAIVLEGAAAAGLLYVLKKTRATIAGMVSAALSWRLAHSGLGLLWSAMFGARNLLQVQPVWLLRFLFLDSLVNGFLIYFLMKIDLSKIPSIGLMGQTSEVVCCPEETTVIASSRLALAVALLVAALSLELVL